MILRLLGAVYAVAFLAAALQVIPLIGARGLLPVGDFLQQVDANFFRLPSLFWWTHTDTALLVAAWGGFGLSCVVALGFANAPMMAALWFLYMSFVNVGQDWYGYGWEIQLLETGFLAIFLCPLTDPRPFPDRPPPFPVIGLFRWLIFRIMLGSALIKLRGDVSWRDGTALYYHFETQPIPGPLSRWFHFLPRRVLQLGVWYNFLAELIAPFFAFWPRIGRHIAGVLMVLLQLVLICSGNLSFLNWLTIVPALACFDDGFWSRLLPRALVRRAEAARDAARPSRAMTITAWTVTGIVAMLSILPVTNLLSSHQVMNTSYDPLNLVNTYGAFGSVGQERYNIVFEGSLDSVRWIEYRYKGLPVDTDRRPLQIAPFQPRLDWQMWFAAMSTPDQYLWTVNLVYKLLRGQPDIVGLFADNPFPGRPPRYIRAVLYKYAFARPGSGHWWRRQRLGNWMPVLSLAYFGAIPTER
ncbi:MAG TPA: lipase maturation factor family protein [Dinghuibacter sp.]|uniref:lipase maturation factor family protein n=1 Tax=Dinghuibacter sp. TaxID=2024697 RepID=UPI002BAFB663|nr:lipase maturation factor family protein [Dinghuibacter sp.]HTJ13322.1 lipase maturation factor family protein [Dinghuibacter sp.]